ncbi:uncharacterized protein LOC126825050 [Patella vulgata]|uniref:uncharacterized protein LOC126825050 n=1 Tax=Patella vulgata TaxID=6465 RepID=UPI0021805F56|nr:uncharacterized protein LOC126825050 [Patella vulgata]XP_050410439.1 uncharacterized protein LOC126825050 [Patella vulgata]XP_050410440.1 uncharacterized protein LOC126825050 [Patella vulgata]XP_050410441.1 uncharacterized protein LOC126825050 [Patella vulgata]XP_050410442.1 uncharacterized protein LOC126825050 [Patella vulgata]XP_055957875.1 uncharacterized protein LOC126825050 [Patella vulgata]
METDNICTKIVGNDELVPFDDFDLGHLPEEWRHEELLELIKGAGKLVARVKVTSDSGEDLYSSGLVIKYGGSFAIQTNNKFIENVTMATGCEIEFSFDKEDRNDVIKCVGTGIVETSKMLDKTLVSFEPIPDFLNELNIMDDKYFLPDIETVNQDGVNENATSLIMMSQNKAYLFLPENEDVNKKADVKIRFCDGTVSDLTSNWITFEPIPDELKSNPHHEAYSSCKVLICTTTDGRTVGATTEFFSGHIVLKMLQPVTLEEAKNSVIYFYGDNDNEFLGTGLYFKKSILESARAINGLEINIPKADTSSEHELLARIFDSFWLLSFKPVPNPIQHDMSKRKRSCTLLENDQGGVVVIGHPSGKIKMAAAGKIVRSGVYHDKENGDIGFEVIFEAKTVKQDLVGSLVLCLQTGKIYHLKEVLSANSDEEADMCRAVLGIRLDQLFKVNKPKRD